jgi:5,10-methylene-tetrahydrofolate dehydrogenase/methenyl tetrahydrofolate cyclohydrolase
VHVQGKVACVVGRSNIVGLPAALLLQNRDATVTMVHSKTPNAQQICSQADIVIAACGRTEMVKGDWIKEGAAVIDVGINAVDVRSPRLHPLRLHLLSVHSAHLQYSYHSLHARHRTACHSVAQHHCMGMQDPSKKRGYRLVGDVDFAAASEKASCITPVPGGVGPMTIAMLLSNCMEAFRRQNGL